ncbi:hypothetical protein Y032_0063g3471 [Ancylostoma ceylanicum]|uniref:Uncharacterized protein n=1 Tax=Ancylostoma ceylanicum TaxID=53326 RepID=A0A016U125_9BILA|nr:hypothetical protein Y032_0063g3471 [Ancylostoma ceylanicum]
MVGKTSREILRGAGGGVPSAPGKSGREQPTPEAKRLICRRRAIEFRPLKPVLAEHKHRVGHASTEH